LIETHTTPASTPRIIGLGRYDWRSASRNEQVKSNRFFG
jgi:hypothetical protein